MKIIKLSSKTMSEACNSIKNGGLVVFPCETVYGIAVDCLNQKAVMKLNEFKQRPLGKPYAIMCSSKSMAGKYVSLNQSALNIYHSFLPGPITVISNGKHKVAAGIESETGSLGVRIPDYPFMLELIQKLGRPIVATSANASYKKRPYKIRDILDNISEKQKGLIDLIIDAGILPRNDPSTVIDTTLDNPTVLRQGNIIFKDNEKILSRSEENTQNTAKELWQKYETYLGKRPIVFALEGPMGAGKTQFVKGLAHSMGINEVVLSPTFNLIANYKPNSSLTQNLTHIDAWRLQDSSELEAIELSKYVLDKNNVTAIEWAEKVIDSIKKYSHDAIVVWIKIEYGKNINDRYLSWKII